MESYLQVNLYPKNSYEISQLKYLSNATFTLIK